MPAYNFHPIFMVVSVINCHLDFRERTQVEALADSVPSTLSSLICAQQGA